MLRIRSTNGYSLIELIVVIVIVGILAGVTMRSLRSANDTSRTEETKAELNRLAEAIVGTPDQSVGGVRTSYGYIGDNGSLPPNLSALLTNPGYSTWNGPYIHDQLSIGGNDEFTRDAWGVAYVYNTATATITSTGGGTSISRKLAANPTDLTINRVTATVVDLKKHCPGATYRDSVKFVLSVPNGSGSLVNRIKYPSNDGYVQFDSIPIGLHELRTIYLPTGDTLTRRVNVEPGTGYHAEITLPRQVW